MANGHEGPGPQVPPRISGQANGQDRVLSVSGKKKCSHCKEELGELRDIEASTNLLETVAINFN